MTREPRPGSWVGRDLVVEPPWPNPLASGSALLAVHVGKKTVALREEEALHLRDWLSHHLGGTPAPHAPDPVRSALDEQLHELRTRSATSDSEDFRAGLAWAQRALTEVATAAGRSRTRQEGPHAR